MPHSSLSHGPFRPLSAHRSAGGVAPYPEAAGRVARPSFSREAIWRAFGGDPALVSEFLALLIRELPQWVHSVATSVSAGELPGIDQAVNQMRGAIGQAEASAVIEMVNAIEHRARSGYRAAIPPLCAGFEAATATLLRELEAWADELGDTGSDEPALRPAHVLVCDDDRSTRFIVSAIVRRTLRCQITECDNGNEALRLAAAGGVDVMILDIGLPVVDGVQVLTSIRQSPRLKSMPVIVLSSERRADIVGRLLELGVSGYELKPPSAERLMAALKAATAARHRAESARSVSPV